MLLPGAAAHVIHLQPSFRRDVRPASLSNQPCTRCDPVQGSRTRGGATTPAITRSGDSLPRFAGGPSGQAPDSLRPGQHLVQHRLGQPSGEGVLLADVEAAQHGRARRAAPPPRRARSAAPASARARRRRAARASRAAQPKPPSTTTARTVGCRKRHSRRQPRRAGGPLLGRGPVRRRRAADRQRDADVAQLAARRRPRSRSAGWPGRRGAARRTASRRCGHR